MILGVVISRVYIDGTFDITAGNDGIQSNNDEAADKGWISLQGGSFNITSAHDGIQAETSLTISGGDIAVLAGGGHTASEASSESYKGLKVGGNLEILGGTMRIDSLDDAVHSNSYLKRWLKDNLARFPSLDFAVECYLEEYYS